MQRQERVLELLKEHDPEQVGTVPKGHFMDTIKGLEAPVLPEQLTQVTAHIFSFVLGFMDTFVQLTLCLFYPYKQDMNPFCKALI